MALKDKMYQFIAKKQLFGNSYDEIMKKFYQENINAPNYKNKVNNAVEELIKDGKIKIEDNKIINTKTQDKNKGGFFSGKLTYIGASGKIRAVINGVAKEFFVPKNYTEKAPNNSIVHFNVIKRNHDEIAHVKKVMKVENTIVTGFVTLENNHLILIPDDKRFPKSLRVFVNKELPDCVNKKVWAEIDETQFIKADPDALIHIKSKEQILGSLRNPWTHLEAYLTQNQIKTDFNAEVEKELEELNAEIPQEEYEKRVDLRHMNFTTIDPETVKEMDDAVYVEKTCDSKGRTMYYDVYIAISDVSHLVKSGTAIDKAAYNLGNNYYPADNVISMFPKKVNDICSFDPDKDKLAVVTKVRLYPDGKIMSYEFMKAVINSKCKFSYEQVSALHHNEKQAVGEFKQFKGLIDNLYEVTNVLSRQANRKNRLSIKSYEPTIILNKERNAIADIVNKNMLDSYKVIEHLMVLNNVVVAQFLNTLGVNHVLRVHQMPEMEMFNSLIAQVKELKFSTTGGLSQRTYANILATVKGHPLEKIFSALVVRSMQKAKYDIDTLIGHFALAVLAYSHFTSPIRRYPDLAEHRILFKAIELMNEIIKKENIDTNEKTLEKVASEVAHKHYAKFKNLVSVEMLSKMTGHFNNCEDKSSALENIANKLSFCLLLEDRVGTVVSGYVSQIGKEGATVTLEDKNDPAHSGIIEVLIPLSEYAFIKTNKKNKQEAEMKKELALHLGDNVDIMLTKVDILNRVVYATHDKEKFAKYAKKHLKTQYNEHSDNEHTDNEITEAKHE